MFLDFDVDSVNQHSNDKSTSSPSHGNNTNLDKDLNMRPK
jgi:hypothetical protein